MARNDATTNDEAGKAAAVIGKAGENAKVEPPKVEPPEGADTAQTGQPTAPADASKAAASAGAPGAAAQPADGVTQENTNRRPVAIEVISRVEGFWRGNRQWTIAPQTVPLSELTDRRLEEIMEEPLLIVRDVYEGER
ncbi:hypothetical protein ACT2FY_44930 [Paraburkholderia fungorum]|uniref:hypothetical protein n=1 Tax=Paraburkholderia fungorum TaxID=134537 RepID=UPI00402B95B1